MSSTNPGVLDSTKRGIHGDRDTGIPSGDSGYGNNSSGIGLTGGDSGYGNTGHDTGLTGGDSGYGDTGRDTCLGGASGMSSGPQ